MIKTPSDHLLDSLEELGDNDFEKFKFKLSISLEKDHSRIPWGHLQNAKPVKLATLMITHYGEENAARLTLQVLRAMNQNLLAEKLNRVIGPELLIQASGTDGSAMSCSSGENKPKGLKIPDGLKGDRQRQNGDGAPGLPSSQQEAGRGPQKKPPGKQRDQKSSEGLDMLRKSRPRSMTLGARRSPLPSKPQGEKGSPSARLPRNANSLGRLQELDSGSHTGSLGRIKPKISEGHLPSGQKRPRSLELNIFLGERETPKPETLLSQDKMRSDHPDSAAAPSEVATLDVGATVAPEKGSRNPEHSMISKGGVFRNTLSTASLSGDQMTWEHPESTGPSKKNGIEGQEPPEALREMVGSELHYSSGLEVPSSGNSSTAMSPGKPQDEAVYPPGRAQERDDSCRYSIASREPKTSGKCSSSSLVHLASLTVNNSEDYKQQEGLHMATLSPKSLPQCERHMKQVQLLFCEDHREPICLICSLSQEHRGHQVRPIEEAALEYKEQIQKQLEHLKALRKSGEEQRSQGDKKTAKLLKQTETQKQRLRHQLEQLYHHLQQQEKLFVASLEDLSQTIGQVREKYSTQVSRDIAHLDKLIGDLEAKQSQPEWQLMQDIGVTLHRVKIATVPKPWYTPPEVEKKIHLIYQKSEFMEKSMKSFWETLRSEMDIFNVPELICAQAHAVNVILDTETAHPNLIFSNNLKSVRLGNKWNRLPDNPERFDSCTIALGLPSFLSGRHYWEVEVGNKTGWILGICKASASRKGTMTLSANNGYWVVMMMKRNEYQVSTIPPTRLQIREAPKRVGIFLDYMAGDISFYNVTYKSLIYTFTSFSFSGALQPMFSPGIHDGGKNMDPLTICPMADQRPQ
ncbi:pyrin isoform X1 [Mustela erminea]|uniref:pyrin isoform X1 n=1 Tax=Mustela erminea TaxID=36723 RepID=UPI00138736D3|nr:pyrin isoform X1 [Mustela erminea]